jgi:hypothetical protein
MRGIAGRLIFSVGLVGLLCIALPAGAGADPNPNLCPYDTARGAVPEDFALDACVDGTSIYVYNNTDSPVQVAGTRIPPGSPNTGIQFVKEAMTSYAVDTRQHDDHSLAGTTLLLPGDEVRFADGNNVADVDLLPTPTQTYDFYKWDEYITSIIPGVNASQQLIVFVDKLEELEAEYKVCVARSPGFFHGEACLLQRNAKGLGDLAAFAYGLLPSGKSAFQKLFDIFLQSKSIFTLFGTPEGVLNAKEAEVRQEGLGDWLGTWTGPVTQTPSPGFPYSISIDITSLSPFVATDTYTVFGCTGQLSLVSVSSDGETLNLHEHITHQNADLTCLDGDITLSSTGDDAAEYRWTGGGYVASAPLTRAP